MAPRITHLLALALVATLAAATIDPAQTANGQRIGRRSSEGAAESDRSRDDAGNRGFRGRRGGPTGRSDRRGGDSSEADESTPAADARPAASNNRSDADRLRGYAVSLVERYDKNGNMMLEAAERAEMRGKPAEADLNHDDVITVDELVIHLSPNPAGAAAARTSSSSTAASASTSSGSRSNSASTSRRSTNREEDGQPPQRVLGGASDAANSADAMRKSYRFTPPVERLPSGLPSWFKSRDANGDGQVAMHEYSRSWSDRTAAEFVRYDKDNDGVITPAEASQR